MALAIKDGAGSSTNLKTDFAGGEHTPHHIVDSIGGTVSITGSTTVSNSQSSALWITSSAASPIYVSSSIGKELYVANTVTTPIFVTSSNSQPVITKDSVATSISRAGFSSFAGTINWAGTGSSDISGTFILAPSSSTRRGLMFANNTDRNLYIALGDTDLAATNGFLLSTTASAPSSYSFILYSSGTYFAEPEFVTFKHSGFFISSSVGVSITAVSTE